MSSALILDEGSSQIHDDHGGKPSSPHETARIWRHPALHGVELFQGIYTSYEFARHFHSVPAIGIVDRGSMRTYCRRATHFVPERTVLLLNPGEVHAPGPADEQGWSFRIFFFDDPSFGARFNHHDEKSIQFSTPFVQDDLLADKLLDLHLRLETQALPLEAEAAIYDLFEYLTQRYTDESGQTPVFAAEEARIKRVRDYLNASYAKDITLAELSAIADLSPSHFLRCFRASLGITPHAYLIQRRIEASKSLLRQGDAISDVAAATGFTDQSHFTRHFKRITGVTPGRYLPRDISEVFTTHLA